MLATRAQLGAARGFARPRTRLDEDGDEIIESVKDVPGQPAVLRRRQLDRARIPARSARRAGDSHRRWHLERRQRRGHPQRRAAAIVGKLFDRNLTVVGFVDSGQVFREAGDLDLARLRGTGGFGFRYDSPLGPVRLDFGFKMNRMVYGNGRRERGWEYHLSIGEAF